MLYDVPKKPLFMWAGGKSKVIAKHHDSFLPQRVEVYHDPFLGGGGALLHVLKTRQPSIVYASDVYEGIIKVYKAIESDVEAFRSACKALEASYMPLDHAGRKKRFYEVRHKHAWEHEGMSPTEEAAHHYFLQKTAFNGILQFNKNTNNRFGTPAGLLNQKNSLFDYDLIDAWSAVLKRVNLHACDWRAALERVETPSARETLVYLDPPYRDSFAKYGTAFDDEETSALLAAAQTLDGAYIAFCNRCDGGGFFEDRKGSLEIHKFSVTYTAGRRLIQEDGGYQAVHAKEVLLYGRVHDQG